MFGWPEEGLGLVQGLNLDLSAYDGIALRLKGDGQMYKINLKTEERGDNPESTYAATFETQDGELTTHLLAQTPPPSPHPCLCLTLFDYICEHT